MGTQQRCRRAVRLGSFNRWCCALIAPPLLLQAGISPCAAFTSPHRFHPVATTTTCPAQTGSGETIQCSIDVVDESRTPACIGSVSDHGLAPHSCLQHRPCATAPRLPPDSSLLCRSWIAHRAKAVGTPGRSGEDAVLMNG
jgi:hypothetical protein